MQRRFKFVFCVGLLLFGSQVLLLNRLNSGTMKKANTQDTGKDSEETIEIPESTPTEHSVATKSDTKLQAGKYQKVHVFYYQWYANPEFDPEMGYNHWNHRVLPHWDANIRKKFPYNIKYEPPYDLGCSYFPERGSYSSSDPKLLEQHMESLKDYVVAISWWGQADKKNSRDGEGNPTDRLTVPILDAAVKFGTQIAFHIEPYTGK
eukprot:TRINITY_DN1794_c0_g1_i2.p1 TRINITY_DN1794_c0_g1~~TRINITY_DN1794_c0_g1_i2.p1  ORF type:complete len:206 (-),score=36.51 TRINITY_DN1794_c0_g1_i2:106-723(-)